MAIQSRKSPYRGKLRERLAVLAYVKVHGVAPAAQRFGLDRKTVRTWRDRYRAHGESGLVPRYPTRRPRRIPAETVALIAHARTECRYGACRTRLWLIRVHERTVATKTITRICEDLGLPPLQRVKAEPGPTAAHAVRETAPRGFRPGRRQGREARRHEGLPVHRSGRLHPPAGPPPLSPPESAVESRVFRRGTESLPIPDPPAPK